MFLSTTRFGKYNDSLLNNILNLKISLILSLYGHFTSFGIVFGIVSVCHHMVIITSIQIEIFLLYLMKKNLAFQNKFLQL